MTQPVGADTVAQLGARIADAIRGAAHDCDSDTSPGAGACRAQHPIQIGAWRHQVVSDVYGPVDAITGVVLAAVQPEMERAEEAEAEVHRMRYFVASCGEDGHAVRTAALALQRAEQAEAALARVREIHQPAECVNVRCKVGSWCIGCDPEGLDDCTEHPWPCPTVAALTAPSPPAP